MADSKAKRLFRSYIYVGSLVIIPALATGYALYQAYIGNVGVWDIVQCAVGVVLIMLGATVGYHRMLVHRSFEAHPVVRAFFLMLGSMAMQGPAITWASIHRKHHAFSDDEGDPHSPNIDTFVHSHFEWMMEMSFDDVYTIREKYGKPFEKDSMAVFFDKTFYLWVAVGLLIPFALGGWNGLLWGGLVRTFLTSHITWSVNSWCHVAGNRMFNTKDQSRNNWIVAILAMGEGWHNNHHAFPSSAFHGMKWWQVDLSAYIIRGLEKVRLAHNVVRIPQERIEQQLSRTSATLKHVQENVQHKVQEATQAAHDAAEVFKTRMEEQKEKLSEQAVHVKETALREADELAAKVESAISPKEKLA